MVALVGGDTDNLEAVKVIIVPKKAKKRFDAISLSFLIVKTDARSSSVLDRKAVDATSPGTSGTDGSLNARLPPSPVH